MNLFTPADLERRLQRVNAARRTATLDDGETFFETVFGVSRRLAVYGSLAPGKENHHVIAHLSGDWTAGYVRGTLQSEGWGASMGYPAIRLAVDGDAVPVQVLESSKLPSAWIEIDTFEGGDYCRVLVAVVPPKGEVTVANIYEVR